MSTWQRQKAGALRAKYARVYELPIEQVIVRLLDDEDAEVYAPGLPRWTLGVQPPRWVADHKVARF